VYKVPLYIQAKNVAITYGQSGMGNVQVYKAPLVVIANNLTMTQGGPVPALTYMLTGFVNGDTAATSVTGAPGLTTTATSASKPRKYPITISPGSLASTNYTFDTVNGVLTVVP
jgi:MBG domain (YGX type)